jgi:hypothetical protein
MLSATSRDRGHERPATRDLDLTPAERVVLDAGELAFTLPIRSLQTFECLLFLAINASSAAFLCYAQFAM